MSCPRLIARRGLCPARWPRRAAPPLSRIAPTGPPNASIPKGFAWYLRVRRRWSPRTPPSAVAPGQPGLGVAQEGKAGGTISAKGPVGGPDGWSPNPNMRPAGRPSKEPPHRPVSPTAPVPNTAAGSFRLFPGSLPPKASIAFSAL